MSVYVDPFTPCLRNRYWRHDGVTHLEADTEADLDAFAKLLGLKPEWKQPPPSPPSRHPWPHYDITRRKRDQAVRLGAVDQGRRETVRRWRRWRRDGWPVPDASRKDTP